MAKTGHPNFVYDVSSPWRTGFKVWSLTGNHSGGSFSASDAETFLTGTSSPWFNSFAAFVGAGSVTGGVAANSVTRVAYYNGSDSAPVYEQSWDRGTSPTNLDPTGVAYTNEATDNETLETCCILQCPVGLSSTGKPVYLRKYIHGIPSGNLTASADGVVLTILAAGTTAAHNMGNGSWFGSRVYCSPTGRQPVSSTDWAPLTHPGNHQMPRGRKRKTISAATSESLGDRLLSALAGGAAGAAVDVLFG